MTLGFGLRYFADPGAALRLLRGLLAPAGLLVILEAVRPPQDPLGAAAGLYFLRVAPRLGAALAGRAELYELLTVSTCVLGSADDVIVAAVVLRWVGRRVGLEDLRERWTGDPAGFEVLRRLLGM